DAATGELVAGPFTGHAEEIVGLTFEAGGRTLVSADRKGTLIRWDVDPASWRERACRLARRNLTPEERRTFLPDVASVPACAGR
ncbi:MAG TPA: hypothetical protein DD490_14925, partial [Acidobacteria bacterium]|nr:hypothetical protein [Acidobacteriota bacterium]